MFILSEIRGKPLTKNIFLIIFSVLTIFSILTTLALATFVLSQQHSCPIFSSVCSRNGLIYIPCFQDGLLYCCGYRQERYTYTCQDNLLNCDERGDGFFDCGPFFRALGISFLLSLIFGVITFVLWCISRHLINQPRPLLINTEPMIESNEGNKGINPT